jgi:hypothetical protein
VLSWLSELSAGPLERDPMHEKPRYLPGPYAARQLTLIDQSGDELDRAQFAHERAHRPRGDQSERAGAS